MAGQLDRVFHHLRRVYADSPRNHWPASLPLSTTQLLAHTVGLLVVSGIVLSAQLWALERSLKIGRKRILYGALAFVAAFWIG